MVTEKPRHRKRPITEIGRTVPANLKFGIIVSVAVIWSQFFRSLLGDFFTFLGISGQVLADFFTAIIATVLAYLVLLSYRKIRFRLRKIKV
jgi:hypothetical protein